MVVDKLRSYLKDVPTGKLPLLHAVEIERILFEGWHELNGSEEQNMTGFKLLHRTEDMGWESPLLTFDIERHARQSGGSTRAAVHTWEVNIETGEASIANERLRYIGGMDSRLDVNPLAEELTKLISTHADDPRLRWISDQRVKIDLREFIPQTYRRTTEGRTERLKKRVAELFGGEWTWCREPYHRNEMQKS